MLKLKGFPTQVGPEIELPDMAELLTYPFFFDTSLEDAYKYGSDFQKKLLDSIPNLGKNGKRNISVLSQVRVLAPNYRSCTGPSLDYASEWHIDSEEDEDGTKVWSEPTDIVHILTNQTTSMTEFFEDEIEVPGFNGSEDYAEFQNEFVRIYETLNVKPKAMPANRIVTFMNHMHRATNPTRYEFKYMFRVVETDRMREPSPYNPDVNASTIIGLNREETTNIIRQGNKVTIYVPSFVDSHQDNVPRESYITEMKKASSAERSVEGDTFKTLPVHLIGFESEHIAQMNSLRSFTPPNSIMLISKGNFDSQARNKSLLDLFQKMNKDVRLVSDSGEVVNGNLEKDFYNIDDNLGKIAGVHITFSFREFNKIQANTSYKIVLNKDSGYYYDIPENMRFSINFSKLT